jgi:hypothetical protein
MIATTAFDPSGVEYYFAEISGNPGGSDSGWQGGASYTDTGLNELTEYTYRVQARDLSPNQNTTVWSTAASATTPAATQILTVAESGGDYDNIQAAIDACSDGWIVEVEDGFWGGTGNRDLDFGGKAITVRSVNGPENCTINCGGGPTTPHRAFYFHSGEDANSIVEGFTITNGYVKFDLSVPGMDDRHGGAIYCTESEEFLPSSPTIRNCIITNNRVYDESGVGYGGGISCIASAPTISSCVISSNFAYFGGGISCAFPVDLENPIPVPTITNCTISDNVALCDDPVSPYNGYGGGVYCYDSSVAIEDCTIIGNSAFWGGGVCCEYSEDPEIAYPQLVVTRSTISNNSATYTNPDPYDWGEATGGGIAMSPFCGGVISQCTIIGNYAVHYGGGIDCFETSSLEIVNCIISGNVADSGNVDITSAGGAVCCYGSSPKILNCTISSNEAKDYGAQAYDDFGGSVVFCWTSLGGIDSQPEIKNCVFENNGQHAVHEYGDDSDPNLAYCLFHNNSDGDYYDWDSDDTLTGADNINNIPDGFTWDNRDGNPQFFMNDPNKPQEAEDPNWTDEPSLSGNRTTLYDSMASFAVGELVGRHINANMSDPDQRRQAFITANTATTIEVVGDLTGYVAKGDKYKIIDYHLRIDSSCIDTGTSVGSPTIDIEGNPRPIDVPGVVDLTEGNPNGDGIVDIDDILVIANNWLRDDCEGAGSCGGVDMAPPGGDGTVNYLDFAVVSFNWSVEALCDIGAYEFQIDN